MWYIFWDNRVYLHLQSMLRHKNFNVYKNKDVYKDHVTKVTNIWSRIYVMQRRFPDQRRP